MDEPVSVGAAYSVQTHLVADGIWGSDYTQAKSRFVEGIVNRARAVLALEPITL